MDSQTHKHPNLNKLPSYLILTAIILITVGIGNIIVGHKKAVDYKTSYKTIRNEPQNGLSAPERQRYLERMGSRVKFYKLVEKGGVLLTVTGGLTFFVALWQMRKKI